MIIQKTLKTSVSLLFLFVLLFVLLRLFNFLLILLYYSSAPLFLTQTASNISAEFCTSTACVGYFSIWVISEFPRNKHKIKAEGDRVTELDYAYESPDLPITEIILSLNSAL